MVGTRPGNDGRGMHPNTTPLGTATYLYKAKEMKNLARSTKTGAACKGGVKNEQCRHTFEITRAQCAPCAGYNAECPESEASGICYAGTPYQLFDRDQMGDELEPVMLEQTDIGSWIMETQTAIEDADALNVDQAYRLTLLELGITDDTDAS